MQYVKIFIWVLIIALQCYSNDLLAKREKAMTLQPMHTIVQEVKRISQSSHVIVGLAAIHLETKEAIYLNEQQFFPMGSTYKLPLAVRIMDLVDSEKLQLDTMVAIEESEIVRGGILSNHILHPGISLSVYNLLELMLTQSDNTSTDVLFRLAGSPAAVKAHMEQLDLNNLNVARYIRELLLDMKIDNIDIKADQKLDQATPADMTRLLQLLWEAKKITPRTRDLLLEIMGRTTTGINRIRGKLPPGLAVSDKTGSQQSSINDVGIITLPSGKGHLAISIFVGGQEVPVEIREAVIADISRSIVDYFIFK